jgi:hypothetical protein
MVLVLARRRRLGSGRVNGTLTMIDHGDHSIATVLHAFGHMDGSMELLEPVARCKLHESVMSVLQRQHYSSAERLCEPSKLQSTEACMPPRDHSFVQGNTSRWSVMNERAHTKSKGDLFLFFPSSELN